MLTQQQQTALHHARQQSLTAHAVAVTQTLLHTLGQQALALVVTMRLHVVRVPPVHADQHQPVQTLAHSTMERTLARVAVHVQARPLILKPALLRTSAGHILAATLAPHPARQVLRSKSVAVPVVEKSVLPAEVPADITVGQTETAQETVQRAVAVTSTLQIVVLAQQTHARHAQQVRPTTTDASTTLG
jgi:hypothetical protein